MKTALITGASSGIGLEMAKLHAKQKGNLILVARSEDKLNQLKKQLEKEHGIAVKVIAKDLSKAGAAKEVYETTQNQGLKVDYLINNAGFGGVGYFHERNWQDDQNMIQLNVMALTELTRYYLNDMVKRNQGKILNVSSTASLMPGPLQAVYYATKAFVTSFSNAINEELSETNITVSNLMPGATETEFGSVSGMDKTSLFQNTASAESVAKAGYEGMLNGKLDIIAGVPFAFKLQLPFLSIMPKRMILKMIKKLQQTND
ncbi:SDR family NAD(P)-dependent oxidoreductase [Jiulongibacter sp. NS-SX5]|uniref:SDR family NAD(P)-dependent oxidoreductase n=1 Tax=Jiulongibacter sp. NS-SX5 TaxID=3463854 RepID=UPI00405898DC